MYTISPQPGFDEQLVFKNEGEVSVITYSIRADAMREGVAKTPSADAEGRVRLRDPGMGLYENVAPTLDCGQAHGVFSMRESGPGYWLQDEVAGTLDAYMGSSGHANRVATLAQPPSMTVRRLTPRECERLQGFPDDYTLVPYRKGLSADSNRYKALGNSMAVPVMRWIGARIALVDTFDQGDNP